MSTDARHYLLDRFESDAATLRARADSAPDRIGPGPDAATSRRMADACDRVVELVRGVPASEPPGIMLQSLAALTLPLEQLARDNAGSAPVRAVFAGAATRIRELLAAEARVAEPARDSAEDDE